MEKRTIYSHFKDIVMKYPENPAIVEDERTISYSQLDAMVDSIIAKFYEQKPDFVGIVMHHGAEQIAAINLQYIRSFRDLCMLQLFPR